MENRENRIDVAMTSTISAGKFFFEGVVANVSRQGLKMAELPGKFDAVMSTCTAIVTGEGKSFRLVLQPRWSKGKGYYREVGFMIVDSPAGWASFLDQLDGNDADDDDAWWAQA